MNKKSVQWKELLEETDDQLKILRILKRPTYVMNILFSDQGIYLSKRCQKNKEMYNVWQVLGEKVELEESSVQVTIRETKEETGLQIGKEELTYLFNDPKFNCDVYATKLTHNQRLEHTEPEKQGPWKLFNWKEYEKMALEKSTTPTYTTYIREILKSIHDEQPSYN